MNKTVLAALVSAAGLATSAFGQADGTFRIEVRIVADGSADAPTGAGIQSFLPGPQATRVGLTLQARVVQLTSGTNAGSGNYGIASVSATTQGQARLFHNDSVFSGAGYTALGRGAVSNVNGADGIARAGLFDGVNNPDDDSTVNPGGRNFRQFNINNFATPAIRDVNTFAGNAVGATGTNATGANGFVIAGAGNTAGITSIGAGLSLVGAAPTLYATGTFSPWYNLYRSYFDPQPNSSDPVRNVTVSFTGRVSAFRQVVVATGARNAGGGTAQLDTLNAAPITVTFQVPTPGAMALLGLGGLAAARRRRA